MQFLTLNIAPRARFPVRRGAIIVLFAMLLVVVLGFLALSLDLGYICTVKADLQSAVDAGALAGTGVVLEGRSEAESSALRFTEINLTSAGVLNGTAHHEVDTAVGRWDPNSRQFLPDVPPFDAVKVTARVSNASLFFGPVLGRNQFSTEASATATYRPRDIMLVLDVSGSMNEERMGVKKIDELRESVHFFLEFLHGASGVDRVGFSYYSTMAYLGSPLDFDLQHVEDAMMEKLQPGGFTNIADGMRIAIDEIRTNHRAVALPLIVLLTDGAANMIQPGNQMNPEEAKNRVIQQAEDATSEGIPIFTMALDSLSTQVDVELMQRVADLTGSETFHIIAGEITTGGSTELRDAFRRVAASRPLRIVD